MKAAFPSPPCHSAAQLWLSGRKHTSWEGLSKRLLGREEGVFYSTFLLHAARSSWTGGHLEDGSSAAEQRGADDFVGGPGHLRAARFRSS